MNQGPRLLACGRIVSLHTHVETEEEIIEIQTYAKAVGSGQLLVETIEMKHAARLVLVVMDCPDISGVNEKSRLDYPEQFRAILHTHIQAYIAALVDKRTDGVARIKGAGTQSTYVPAPHAICSAAIKAFLERQYAGVAVRISHTQAGMYGQRVAIVENMGKAVVHLSLDILGVADAEDFVWIFLDIGAMGKDTVDGIKQVSGSLGLRSDSPDIALPVWPASPTDESLVGRSGRFDE